MSWNTGTVALGPGTYYLAIQAISPTIDTYLSLGAIGGAAETHDGGTTWSPWYEGLAGVAVDIYGSTGVPEPAAWTMMLVGFAGVGFALRRRNRALAA